MIVFNIFLTILMIASFVVLFFVVTGRTFKIIDWIVHKSMVRQHAKTVKGTVVKGDFNTFHNEMSKKVWGRNKEFPNSFFTPLNPEAVKAKLEDVTSVEEANELINEYNSRLKNYNKNYVHAQIVCFDGNCLELDYNSYKKFSEFLKYYKTEEDDYNWKLSNFE